MLKDRIKSMRRVKAGELAQNPKNWRVHNHRQKSALKGILDDVGIAGALLAYESEEGLTLIDGHCRAEDDPEQKWPVLVLDVTEEEANKLLAVMDPIGAMAGRDDDALRDLLLGLETDSADLAKVLGDMLESVELPPEEDEEDEEPLDVEPLAANVRMVQLFLDDTNVDDFRQRCLELGDHYETRTLTDTVLRVVIDASDRLRVPSTG